MAGTANQGKGKAGTGSATPKGGGASAKKAAAPASGANTPKGSTASASKPGGPGTGAATPKAGAGKGAQKMPFPGANPFRKAGRKS